MDVNEQKIREEITYWRQFIAKSEDLQGEHLLAMARESLAHAEMRLQFCLLGKSIMASRKERRETDDNTTPNPG